MKSMLGVRMTESLALNKYECVSLCCKHQITAAKDFTPITFAVKYQALSWYMNVYKQQH